MQKERMLFLIGIMAIMLFGYSQITSANSMTAQCNIACGAHDCSIVECRCPDGTPNQGEQTDCMGYLHLEECGNPAVWCEEW